MPHKSRWTVPIPQCSLPTFLLKSSTGDLRDGQDTAYIDPERPDTHYLTRSHYLLWCRRLALGLQRSRHFRKGDRVLLFSANNIFVPVVFLGTLCAGGVFTGANPTFTPRELSRQWQDSGATYVLCSPESVDTAIEAASLLKLERDRIYVFDDKILHGRPPEEAAQGLKGCMYWDLLIASAIEAKGFSWDDLTEPGACHRTMALNYSSGTSGVPKGVEITHYNYISNTLQVAQIYENHPEYEVQRHRARWLCLLPLYHAYGQTNFIVGAFHRSIPVFIPPKFDFVRMLGYIQNHRITELILVPPIAVQLAKSPVVSKYDLSSIEYMLSGAAPLGADISRQVEERLQNRVNLKQAWGMTEVTCSSLMWDVNKWSNSQAVGELQANCEAMIVSEDGTEIHNRGHRHTGELWVRGPNVMKGYWNNPQATALTIMPEGWLRTGDTACVDEDGLFFIVDRIKELIKVKGNQVAPAELEGLLLGHEAVVDVAVIGILTADGDERPRAYVVLQPDAKSQRTTEAELNRYMSSRVARYKRLTGGIEFVNAIPKNPSGKILRQELRRQWKAASQSRL